MAVSSKPRKKYKNKTRQRILKAPLNALPVEFALICRPLDNFFEQATRSGEVEVVGERAVFVNDMNHQLMTVKDSGCGLLDSLEGLFRFKKQGEELIEPMRNLFENIDSTDFTFDEIDAGALAWHKAKSILRRCTYGEVVSFSDCDWKKSLEPYLPKGLQ